jgi:hypothetical protein
VDRDGRAASADPGRRGGDSGRGPEGAEEARSLARQSKQSVGEIERTREPWSDFEAWLSLKIVPDGRAGNKHRMGLPQDCIQYRALSAG